MKNLVACLFLAIISFQSAALGKSKILDFEFDDETLNGVLNLPQTEQVRGIVLIVHGYGRTDAVAENWYAGVRAAIEDAGFGTYMWDKMGCGDSTGSFDINQPVANSADETVAAINMLRTQNVPGAETIGLWGISRAGWINPLVIKKQGDIAFWISVSGVDGKENFGYLLEQNLIIDGLSPERASLIAAEWRKGMQIAHKGGSYSEYKKATKNLAENKFWQRFANGGYGFFKYPFLRYVMRDTVFDEESGLQLHIADFETLLSGMTIPVLALFGEKDMNVDWQKTKRLYDRTLDPNQLTTKTFPNCNHSIFEAKTGGYYEFEDNDLPYIRCADFLETTNEWLNNLELHPRASK